MERNKIINKTGLSKLLYSDNSEDKHRNYLNINLLRYLKNYLLQSMTPIERGCINLYHLENYLIERALDPSTEENYKNGEELISNTLDYLRTKPFYWIINTEVYMGIVSKGDNYNEDDGYVNKDLIAIYNYVYGGKIKQNNSDMIVDSTTDPEFDLANLFGQNVEEYYTDPYYIEFVEFLSSPDYLAIDPAKRMLFDSTVVPLLYNYLRQKYCVTEQVRLIKLQNLILFLSYVGYNQDIESIWTPPAKAESIEPISNTKKYNLRLSKLNEDELDEMYLQKQIKIIELQDKLNQVKQVDVIKDFLGYLKTNKKREEIVKGENGHDVKTEAQMAVYIFAYNLLQNIFLICESYINDTTVNTYEEPKVSDLFNFFNTFKLTKSLYRHTLDANDITKVKNYYIKLIEGKINYEGCINLLNGYQKFNKTQIILQEGQFERQFGCNITAEEKLNKLTTDYIDNYYDTVENRNKRVYQTENAGMNWTEEDVKKFHEGLRLYGHCQLANNKIAKFMGTHIHVSHVKLFRSRISKEKQKVKKMEKEVLMKEMKKKKNWKVATFENPVL
jgi:hypothetical protein